MRIWAALWWSMGAAVIPAPVIGQTLAVAPTSPSAQATPNAPSTGIVKDKDGSITVLGRRLPAAEAPRFTTCVAQARAPFFAAALDKANGDPMMVPRIYLPTRMPRNPDYTAPPRVAPGSPLPQLGKPRFGAMDGGAMDAGIAQAPQELTSIDRSDALDPQQQALSMCLRIYGQSGASGSVLSGTDEASFTGQSSGGNLDALRGMDSRFDGVRAMKALRDTNLPMAIALFDQGRYGESLDYFEKANRQLADNMGGDEAALFIGKLYLDGLGLRCDTPTALRWLKRAAGTPFNPTLHMPIFDPFRPGMNTAVGEAAMILGKAYRTGYKGIPRDPEEARKWYRRALDVGHVAAAQTLGDMARAGEGEKADPRAAAEYYRKGARLDLTSAQVAYAAMLDEGDGVARDPKAALGWYQRAATRMNPDALYALGRAYDLGRGLPADPQLALRFYKAGALNGSAAAKVSLGTYFYMGEQLPKNLPTARQWFEAGARAGDTDGMTSLAAMLVRGEGGPRDPALASAWLTIARRLGDEKAKTMLPVVERQLDDRQRQQVAALIGKLQ